MVLKLEAGSVQNLGDSRRRRGCCLEFQDNVRIEVFNRLRSSGDKRHKKSPRKRNKIRKHIHGIFFLSTSHNLSKWSILFRPRFSHFVLIFEGILFILNIFIWFLAPLLDYQSFLIFRINTIQGINMSSI